MFDVKKVEEEARKEINTEKLESAKKRLKVKLAQIDSAKTVLANLEREYADLVATIAEGN